MAEVSVDGDRLKITFSLVDQLLAFHGSFDIPLEHVTNAYVSSPRELALKWRLLGTGIPFLKHAGIFTDPQGLIFCDIGRDDCIVIETVGERFPRIAVEVPATVDPNALAHEIVSRVHETGTAS